MKYAINGAIGFMLCAGALEAVGGILTLQGTGSYEHFSPQERTGFAATYFLVALICFSVAGGIYCNINGTPRFLLWSEEAETSKTNIFKKVWEQTALIPAVPAINKFFKPIVENLPTKKNMLDTMLMSSASSLAVPFTVYMARVLDVERCSEQGNDNLYLAMLQAFLMAVVMHTLKNLLVNENYDDDIMFGVCDFAGPAFINSAVVRQIPIIQCLLEDPNKHSCGLNC